LEFWTKKGPACEAEPTFALLKNHRVVGERDFLYSQLARSHDAPVARYEPIISID